MLFMLLKMFLKRVNITNLTQYKLLQSRTFNLKTYTRKSSKTTHFSFHIILLWKKK